MTMAGHPIDDMMGTVMEKVRTMVDSNTVIGEPITTPDGVMLVPVSRVSFGFVSGGSDRSEGAKGGVWGGSGAGVKVDPVGFLMIRDGTARLVSIQPPAFTTADRVIDMLPDLLEKVDGYVNKFATSKEGGEPAV